MNIYIYIYIYIAWSEARSVGRDPSDRPTEVLGPNLTGTTYISLLPTGSIDFDTSSTSSCLRAASTIKSFATYYFRVA